MKNEIGVIVGLTAEGPCLRYVADFGLKVCQVVCWKQEHLTDKRADQLREESRETRVGITSLWAGWPGPAVWDFVDGPATLGLVPRQYRKERIAALKRAGEFAGRTGLPAIATHLGFIPEDPKDPVFDEVVAAVRDVAIHLKSLNLEFWFETGQETAEAMLRLIRKVGTGNLGINLDPANLILYGKADPVKALDVFGEYVRGVHAKDGLYPTEPMKLGREVRVGEGKVGFPALVKRLKKIGYKGAYIIEREISESPEKQKDIADTVQYLKRLIG